MESILNLRDDDRFAAAWTRCWQDVEAQKALCRLDNSQELMSARVREIAFLRAFERWQSSDLAAYISDDLGMIADALSLKIMNSWVEELLQSYLAGIVPHDIEIG